MNKKTLIQIIVITCAFVASGIVLYNGLFKGSSGTSPVITATAPVKTEDILPYGSTFDYRSIDNLQQKNFVFGAITYPKLDPIQDVGKLPVSSIIQPPQ